MNDHAWPDARTMLLRLEGREVFTVSGSVNTILTVGTDTAQVGTARSPEGRPVDIADVQRGLDKLRAQGSVRVDVATLGHRSAFVGAVLATLPWAQFTKNPAAVEITG